MADEDPILSLRDVDVRVTSEQADLHVLRRLTLDVQRGSFLALVGESGCGKSMTALTAVGLLPSRARMTQGSVTFRSADGEYRIDRLDPVGKQMRALRGAHIGMVFQDGLSALNPAHRVGRQVAECLREHHKVSREEARQRVVETFAALGIPDPSRRCQAYPHELSGGMRQRVMIAMAMICEPELVIADEPTTALDVTIQAQIIELLKGLQAASNSTLVMITHNLALVAEAADTVAVMYLGRVVEHGSTEQVLTDPRHPYTKALLESVPTLGMDPSATLPTIKGQMPSPLDVQDGCEFADRCPYARGECRLGTIAPRMLPDGHVVRCVLVEDGVTVSDTEGVPA